MLNLINSYLVILH